MDTLGTGQTRNLHEGKTEVLQALLNSITPDAGVSANPKLGADQARKIAEKLEDLLGQNEGAEARNEKGELVNEEGLPIIEINEPEHTPEPSKRDHLSLNNTDQVAPWLSATPAQIEARRRHNAHLLDLLEEEEREEEERTAKHEQLQRHNELERRKEAARNELERLKAQRELQRKMGKALMRNVAAARTQEEENENDTAQKAKPSPKGHLKPRKSVSFAELPKSDRKVADAPKSAPLDWGDVVPGRLNQEDGARQKPLDKDRSPMKFDVVERFPSQPSRTVINTSEVDSDDETDPESLSLEERSEVNIPPSDSESTDTLADDDDDTKSHDGIGDVEFLEDDFNFDTAQHQREVALRYFEQRDIIGKEALTAMTAHSHEGGEHEWDQPKVPLEATLSSAPPKPAISKFKVNRISQANPNGLSNAASASTSLGASILPASQINTIQSAIRTGKLEGNKLVGGEVGDSDDELADSNVREFMEMLKKGGIQNVGPDEHATSSLSENSTTWPPAAINNSVHERNPPSDAMTQVPISNTTNHVIASNSIMAPKPRVSKFKLQQSVQDPAAFEHSVPSPLGVTVSQTERSSPKVPAETSTNKLQVLERVTRPADAHTSPPSPVSSPSKEGLPSRAPVLISVPTADSRPPPVHGNPSHVQPTSTYPSLTTMPSMIVDSPSFPRPVSTSTSLPPQSKSLAGVTPPTLTTEDQRWLTEIETVSAGSSESSLRRPAMALQVTESHGPRRAAFSESAKRPSRFLAERSL